MNRRQFVAGLAAALQLKATQLPANKNVKWALSLGLWNHFERPPFTEILDVMKDTGFIGIRLTQYPGFLKTYDVTAAQIEKVDACLPQRVELFVKLGRDLVTEPREHEHRRFLPSCDPSSQAICRPCDSAAFVVDAAAGPGRVRDLITSVTRDDCWVAALSWSVGV